MFNFIKKAREELSRVTWLTKKQAIHLSSITVMFVFLSTVFLWLVDMLWKNIL
jgi:preprotein translocase SecE subunit